MRDDQKTDVPTDVPFMVPLEHVLHLVRPGVHIHKVLEATPSRRKTEVFVGVVSEVIEQFGGLEVKYGTYSVTAKVVDGLYALTTFGSDDLYVPSTQFCRTVGGSTGMSFASAFDMLGRSYALRRAAWDKGQFICIFPYLSRTAYVRADYQTVPLSPVNLYECAGPEGLLPHLVMHSPTGEWVYGWTPNRFDLHTKDWLLYNTSNWRLCNL